MISNIGNDRWHEMIAKSFPPSEWYDRDWADSQQVHTEIGPWLYRAENRPDGRVVYVVGRYATTHSLDQTSTTWQAESEHPTKTQAALRVHYLGQMDSSA